MELFKKFKVDMIFWIYLLHRFIQGMIGIVPTPLLTRLRKFEKRLLLFELWRDERWGKFISASV